MADNIGFNPTNGPPVEFPYIPGVGPLQGGVSQDNFYQQLGQTVRAESPAMPGQGADLNSLGFPMYSVNPQGQQTYFAGTTGAGLEGGNGMPVYQTQPGGIQYDYAGPSQLQGGTSYLNIGTGGGGYQPPLQGNVQYNINEPNTSALAQSLALSPGGGLANIPPLDFLKVQPNMPGANLNLSLPGPTNQPAIANQPLQSSNPYAPGFMPPQYTQRPYPYGMMPQMQPQMRGYQGQQEQPTYDTMGGPAPAQGGYPAQEGGANRSGGYGGGYGAPQQMAPGIPPPSFGRMSSYGGDASYPGAGGPVPNAYDPQYGYAQQNTYGDPAMDGQYTNPEVERQANAAASAEYIRRTRHPIRNAMIGGLKFLNNGMGPNQQDQLAQDLDPHLAARAAYDRVKASQWARQAEMDFRAQQRMMSQQATQEHLDYRNQQNNETRRYGSDTKAATEDEKEAGRNLRAANADAVKEDQIAQRREAANQAHEDRQRAADAKEEVNRINALKQQADAGLKSAQGELARASAAFKRALATKAGMDAQAKAAEAYSKAQLNHAKALAEAGKLQVLQENAHTNHINAWSQAVKTAQAAGATGLEDEGARLAKKAEPKPERPIDRAFSAAKSLAEQGLSREDIDKAIRAASGNKYNIDVIEETLGPITGGD